MQPTPTLEVLIARHRPRLVRFGRRCCGTPADADDATQLAFIALLERPDLRRSATLLPWLHTVVRNACRLFARRPDRRLGALTLALDLPDDAPQPDAVLEQAQRVQHLERALEALGPAARAVVALRDLEERSTVEVAAQLRLSPGATRTRLHRAHRALLAALVFPPYSPPPRSSP
jgi:RNA polymerase sigma factor (sigma-70 family)